MLDDDLSSSVPFVVHSLIQVVDFSIKIMITITITMIFPFSFFL